jgi:hypothetical protein
MKRKRLRLGRRRPRRRGWPRGRLGRLGRLLPRSRAARRIWAVAVALVALLIPVVVLTTGGTQPAASCASCQGKPATAERWAAQLPGTWTASAAGTEPAYGQAYVAVGGGLAVVGNGLALGGYALADGKQRWQVLLNALPGSAIMSVRAWAGVVTVGLLNPAGHSRTELVIDARTGAQLRRYRTALFGGAVSASTATTVIVGASVVTGYDNATGRRRWQHATAAGQSWQTDGKSLYVAQYAGANLGSSAVTALKVINLSTGGERVLGSPVGHPFSGSLALASGGAVLFATASGVTAYGGSTGDALWTRPGGVPEGADPAAHLIYLTAPGGALTGVDPLTGKTKATIPSSAAGGPAGMYVVRAGVALGLNPGVSGQAWGYDVAAGQVAWTSAQLPWPHYFADMSGLGGSAETSGDLVAVTACPQLTVSGGLCATPELVVFALLSPGARLFRGARCYPSRRPAVIPETG